MIQLSMKITFVSACSASNIPAWFREPKSNLGYWYFCFVLVQFPFIGLWKQKHGYVYKCNGTSGRFLTHAGARQSHGVKTRRVFCLQVQGYVTWWWAELLLYLFELDRWACTISVAYSWLRSLKWFQLLERALEGSGDDLDSAIKTLKELDLVESTQAILSATGCIPQNGLPTATQPSAGGSFSTKKLLCFYVGLFK